MGISKYTLYKYVKVDGTWRYCKAAYHDNGKIKPDVGNEENPSLVTFDENFKRSEIPTFRSSDQGQISFVGATLDRGNRRFFLVNAVCELGWHRSAPSESH